MKDKIVMISIEEAVSHAPIIPAAYSIAEPGACGTCGECKFFDERGQAYKFNYLRSSITGSDIDKLCPIVGRTRLQTGGQGDFPPDGWVPFYLGLGNHLFMHKELFMHFVEELMSRGIKSVGEVYKDLDDIVMCTFKRAGHTTEESSSEQITLAITASDGKSNFDIIEKNAGKMVEGPFTILELLTPP